MKYEKVNVWDKLSDEEMVELEEYSKKYIDFLSKAKTERLATKIIVEHAKEVGFISLEEALKKGPKAGDAIYAVNKGKGAVLIRLGKDLSQGMDIVGAHIDAPRLDLKPNPLTEAENMAYLKTHYYGGVKKYHWTNLPLALHGVVFRKDGSKAEISIGEDPTDPVFYINDLLIHLSRKLLQEKAADVISGEQLQIVIGSSRRGSEKDDKNPVSSQILKILNEKYGIEDKDFQFAEIEAVPAGPAREVGFDRSMIMGHGHDDRICSFAALEGIINIKSPERTAVALFVDKEEVGSIGNTGMTSMFFENVVAELLAAIKDSYSDLDLRRVMANSRVLSADVTAAYDPQFPSVFDESNNAALGCGLTITKYTGSGGKGGSNDANAEFLSQLRQIFDEAGVIYQTGELGAVDAGGGGTIAYILARYGAEVVDCGTGMLSMHAPLELASKADAYETYKGYKAFLAADK